MAQSPPPLDPRQFWPSLATERSNLVPAVLVLAGGLVIAILFFGMVGGPFGVLSIFPVVCAFFLILLAIVVAGVLGLGRMGARRVPPPPPIQQALVPAGQQGPIELACPNCGGPPQLVDRFGIATCGYCGTRFLVR